MAEAGAPAPKPKCPGCGVELVLVNGELPEECASCKFVIEGYSVFEGWFKKAMKAYEEGKTPPPPPAPKKKGLSLFQRKRKAT